MEIDESFKRAGEVPFKWEIKPGTPKAHQPPSNISSHKPSQKLRPPPAGSNFSPPLEFGTPLVRSASSLRSERKRFEQLSPARTISVPPGCFPTPLLKRKGDNKKSINKARIDFDYASNLETLARWSSSPRKSFSPFCDSPSSSFSSYQSSPRPVADAEWAAFGLF